MGSSENEIKAYEPSDNTQRSNSELLELLEIAWRGRWIILLITFVFSIIGTGWAISLPNIYHSSALLAPVTNSGTNDARISGQLGGLASLAGIKIGSSGADRLDMAKEILTSRKFLANFIHQHELSTQLIATNGWNLEKQKWIIDKTLYDPESQQWLTGRDGESLKPTDWDLVKKFKKEHLRLSTNPDNGMVTLTIISQSPLVAKSWVDYLVNDINQHMRKLDVEEARSRIAYLESKLRETSVTEMKSIFYQLIQSETRTIMLANAREEYIFQTIDPAVVPQEKAEPSRALIAIIMAFLGGIVSTLYLLTRYFLKQKNNAEESKNIN